MMRVLVAVLVFLPGLALAQQQPSPEIAALGQMIGEAQQREAVALMRAHRAEQELAKIKATAPVPTEKP